MDFPKKQAQRLIPEYLLDYTEKLQTNHPDPTESWGGGSGGSYTGGDGINISNENVISVDNTIAKKSEIPTNYVTLDTNQTITGLKTIGQTDGTISEVDFSGFTFKLSNKAINHPEADIKIRNASYDGYQYPTIYSTKGLYVNLAKIKLGDDGNNTYGITMPDSSTWESDKVLATIDDIPDTSTFVTTDTNQTIIGSKTFQGDLITENTAFGVNMRIGPSRFTYYYDENGIQKSILFDLPTDKATGTLYTLATTDDIPTIPTLATVATTGSYNDLTDKPTIPDTSNFVTTDTMQTITGSKTFRSALCTEDTYAGTSEGFRLYISTSQFQYEHFNGNQRENTLFKLPTSKPSGTVAAASYTLATTDDIPTVNNPTITFTQGGTTKGTITLNQSGDQTIEFDAGSGGGGKEYFHCIRYYEDLSNSAFINIKNNSSEPFTISSLCTYLRNVGCTESSKLFVCSGGAKFSGSKITPIIGCYAPDITKVYVSDFDGYLKKFPNITDTVTEV